MKKKNDSLNFKINVKDSLIFDVYFKEGQKNFLKRIAKYDGLTLDELVERRISTVIDSISVKEKVGFKTGDYAILKVKNFGKFETWVVIY